jgi:peroxiredoxin
MASALRPAAYGILFGSLVLALSGVLRAEDKQPAAAVDPKVVQVIDAWGKYTAGLKGMDVSIQIEMHVTQGANSNDLEVTQHLQAERPNKLLFLLESGPGGGELVCDGTDVTIFFKTMGKYLVQKAPEDGATWEKLLENPIATAIINGGNAGVITAALLADDPAARLLSSVESATYGGEVMLDDVKCHLIEAVGKELDWQLWIDAGPKPLVRKFVPDLNKAFAKMAKGPRGNPALAGLQVRGQVDFKNWQENPSFAADAFAFKAPEGAVKIDDLSELRGGGAAAGGPHPLLAKVAPAIKLDLLGGGTLDLAALKGKNVVILDFWATWCGPCQRAMPIIEKVAAEYKEKGVLLYAVNIQETPEVVQKFIDESELHLPIAFDKDGAVAMAYQASAIPQTVIVGKDGTVQVVHVGLSPDLENELKKELDALVAGKDLAAAAKAKADKGKGPAAAEAGPSEK